MKFAVGAIAIALATSWIGSAGAASISGIGAVKCTAFNTDIQSDSSKEDLYFDWTQGYISGLNIELEAAGGKTLPSLLPDGFGVAEQKAFTRNFCASYPTEDFASAGDQIFLQIRRMYNLTS